MDRIKESFDSLPIAACFFDKNGVARLINRRMLAIASWLRKGGLQSLAELQSALHSPPANVRCLDLRLRIYRFPDGKALRFAQEQITTKTGVRYTQITAADVTELIRKQNQLKAENAKLEEANERLRLLFAQIPEIIREEETLAMKLRVHDDMEVSLTNNGAVPKEKITEGGGLSMLRQRMEEAGGKMEVWSIPRFKLMLSLPEQEEAAHESDDR